MSTLLDSASCNHKFHVNRWDSNYVLKSKRLIEYNAWTLELEVQIEVPIDSNTLVRATLTSDALIMLAGTTPDLSKPLAIDSAIMPAPINPTRVLPVINSVAMLPPTFLDSAQLPATTPLPITTISRSASEECTLSEATTAIWCDPRRRAHRLLI